MPPSELTLNNILLFTLIALIPFALIGLWVAVMSLFLYLRGDISWEELKGLF